MSSSKRPWIDPIVVVRDTQRNSVSIALQVSGGGVAIFDIWSAPSGLCQVIDPSIGFYKADIDEGDIALEKDVESVRVTPSRSVTVALTLGLDPHIHCLQRGREIRRSSLCRSRWIYGTFPLPDVITDG